MSVMICLRKSVVFFCNLTRAVSWATDVALLLSCIIHEDRLSEQVRHFFFSCLNEGKTVIFEFNYKVQQKLMLMCLQYIGVFIFSFQGM